MALIGFGLIILTIWGVAIMMVNTLRMLKPYDNEFVWLPWSIVSAVYHDLHDYQ